jgi:predicted NAD/FAD-binding protein
LSLQIAVIGAGVAGIAAAYLLQRAHRVTLFEKNDYFGGHTHTVEIPVGEDRGTPVDTGFIVMNDRTYPLFSRFLSQLRVATAPSEMSFSYHCEETGVLYAGAHPSRLFARRSNLFRIRHWLFLTEIHRFYRKTLRRLENGSLQGLTLGEYFRQERFSRDLVDWHIVPMAASIWSTPDAQVYDFPAERIARFYERHGLLRLRDRPRWHYIPGGSHTYVKAFLKGFRGRAVAGDPVRAVSRNGSGVTVRTADGSEQRFDRAVIAAHADEALGLLANPTDAEARLLSAWQYSANRTILHRDASYLPPLPRAWASWNYVRSMGVPEHRPVTLTYLMNRLQKLQTAHTYCVSLNPARPVPQEEVVDSFDYSHPVYDMNALGAQRDLPVLNRQGDVYFCGSYFGYGFHEDAVRSAVNVADHFGIEL